MSQQRYVIRTIALTLLSLAIASIASSCGRRDSAKTVAVVNGTAIPRSSLDREISRIEQQMTQDGYVPGDDEDEDIMAGALDGLINMELLFQESQKRGFTVTESRLDMEFSMFQANFQDAETYKQALTQMQLTEGQLKTEIERGMAVNDFIDKEIRPNATVSDEELRDFYDANPEMFSEGMQVRARHIIITVAEDASDEQKQAARTRLEGIRQQIEQGGDFEELAKQHSEGPSNAQGGDLGYFGRGQMVPPFESAAFSLPIGETSDIVTTQFGYHLIQVTDKKVSDLVAFDDVQSQLRDYLVQTKLNERVLRYVDELRSTADIATY